MSKKNEYNADDVKAIEGLHVIRHNTSMYIGSSGNEGLGKCVFETTDNVLDESLAGRNDYLKVYLEGGYKRGAFVPTAVYTIDNGGGIPVEVVKKDSQKRTALHIVTGHVHGGAKSSDGGGYKSGSIGTHGVGIKATNAMSKAFSAYTYRNKAWYLIEYQDAEVKTLTRKAKKTEMQVVWDAIGETRKSGTIIRFEPDYSLFDKGTSLSLAELEQYLETSSYFNPNTTIELTYPSTKGKPKNYTYHNPEGIEAYLEMRLEEYDCDLINEVPIVINGDHFNFMISFTNVDGCHLEGFTNTLYNSNRGGHNYSITNQALADSLEPFKGKLDYNKDDVREGVVGIINFKIPTPKFSSQTKERLSDARFEELCYEPIFDGLVKYFKKNKETANLICQRAAELRKAKSSYASLKKAGAAIKKLSKKGNQLLPGKLVSVDCDPNVRELFSVEGDSAGGGAKAARMSTPIRYQETLALRGKILNVYSKINKATGKVDVDRIMQSAEVLNILVAIGFDPTHKDPISNLRISSYNMLSDADDDGAHINVLQCGLFAAILPEMFERGMLYMLALPKYKFKYKNVVYFGNSVNEIQKQLPNKNIDCTPTYLKGLGEMEPSDLRTCAFNPATRKRYRLNPPSISDLMNIELLMGSDPAERKRILGMELVEE